MINFSRVIFTDESRVNLNGSDEWKKRWIFLDLPVAEK